MGVLFVSIVYCDSAIKREASRFATVTNASVKCDANDKACLKYHNYYAKTNFEFEDCDPNSPLVRCDLLPG